MPVDVRVEETDWAAHREAPNKCSCGGRTLRLTRRAFAFALNRGFCPGSLSLSLVQTGLVIPCYEDGKNGHMIARLDLCRSGAGAVKMPIEHNMIEPIIERKAPRGTPSSFHSSIRGWILMEKQR